MEAKPVEALPTGEGWLFEPKYDGFRCVAFHDGDQVQLQSKNQRPLARYFPELADGLLGLPRRFVIDGEIVIPGETFETLQLRLHPAVVRIARLSEAHPATLIAFDLLQDADGEVLMKQPLSQRRAALESMLRGYNGSAVALSRSTMSRHAGSLSLAGPIVTLIDGKAVMLVITVAPETD